MHDVRAVLAQSGKLLAAGLSNEALQRLESALDLDPRCAWAWAHHGDISYQHLGRYADAVQSLSRAIELDSTYAWAIAHRGAAYERLDLFTEAEQDLSRALQIKPEYTWALAMLARVYQMTGRFPEAFDAVEAVVERDHCLLPYWREERAMMRMLLRRHEEAAAYFQIALDADPEDRFAHYNSVVNAVFWRGVVAAGPAIAKLRTRLNGRIRDGSDSREVDRCMYELGGLAALEGNHEQALEHLQAANRREAGLVLLSPGRKRARVDMAWNPLRQDPRFLDLIQTSARPSSPSREEREAMC